MTKITRRRRIVEVAKAARRARALTSHDNWTREQLLAHRDERLAELRAYACEHSAYYRERAAAGSRGGSGAGSREGRGDGRAAVLPAGGGRAAADPAALMDKDTLLARYDDIVTDPRLSFARLEDHLERLDDDGLLDGYRVMGTGGTSGQRALFPYNADEWREVTAAFLRWGPLTNRRPKPGLRIAAVTTTSSRHMTARLAQTIDFGLMRVLRLDAAAPRPQQTRALQQHRPDELHGYPSALALLALEQLEGRLDIAPTFISTSSEVRTQEMSELIEEAWGLKPYDVLGVTEAGIMAADCPAHAGLHVFEDQVAAEVLDEDGNPTADGELGRLVITPLHLKTLPLLRYDTGDLVRGTTEPCECGRPYMRLTEIQGRADDILHLPATKGGEVAIHPMVVRSPLAAARGVAQYQVVHDAAGLHIALALRGGADGEATVAAVRHGVAEALRTAGADVALDVTIDEDLPSRRTAIGKHRLVVQS
jgi:phenylacetate-coenzyme A ligase PaaK-like adenylate-forming protein